MKLTKRNIGEPCYHKDLKILSTDNLAPMFYLVGLNQKGGRRYARIIHMEDPATIFEVPASKIIL